MVKTDIDTLIQRSLAISRADSLLPEPAIVNAVSNSDHTNLRPQPMTPRFALLALFTLPLAACDEASMSDFRQGIGLDKEEVAEPATPAQPRPPAVSPLDVPIETGVAPGKLAINANAETLNTSAFAARGNEPAWFVEVSGDTATYKTPGNPGGRSISVNRLTFAQGVEYVGVLNERVFSLNIRGNDCQDTMSGKKFPMTASLKVDGKTLSGCASPAAAPSEAPAAEASASEAPQG